MMAVIRGVFLLGLGLAMAAPAHAAPEILRTEKLNVVTEHATVLDSSIQGKGVIDYRIAVRKGQSLMVTVASESLGVRFNVLAPNAATVLFDGSISGNLYEEVLSQDGEYVVRVYLGERLIRKMEPTRFKMTVGIQEGQG